MTLRLGRYETVRAIASGGMATVHLARILGAGGFERFVAIKVMHPHIATDPDFVAMFLDEARLAARVRHPNVVATIDVQEDPLFLVMEYVEGPTLHLLLKEVRKAKRALPLDVGLRIFLDVLAGLHAAHELTGPDGQPLRVVHRDVSPQNLLVGVDGVTRITDFGVARAESRLSSTRGGQLKGKLAYMAPEQIRSEPVDRRCDVYAAGAVYWEMLTGLRVFRNAENDGALLAMVLGGATTSPRECNPDVPIALDRVCMHALRLAVDERYASAADLGDALEAAAATAGVAVASSRAVSAFVKSVVSHDRPVDSRSSPSSPSSPASALASASARAAAATPVASAPMSSGVSAPGTWMPPASGSDPRGPVSHAPMSSVTATGADPMGEVGSGSVPRTSLSVAGMISSQPPRAGLFSARAAVFAVIAVLGVAGALLLGMRLGGGRHDAGLAESAAGALPPSHGAQTQGAQTPGAPTPPADSPAVPASAAAGAAASASSGASSRTRTRAPAAGQVQTSGRSPASPPTPTPGSRPAKPPASPTSFRPTDL